MTSASQLTEDDWQLLVGYIQSKKVIPIVGPQLVTIEEDGKSMPLTRWLLPRLAERLQLKDPAGFASLNDLACAFLLTGRKPVLLKMAIKQLLESNRFEPPPALLQIVQIADFDLIISTTFDNLLIEAMQKIRPGFASSEDVLIYTGSGNTHLPSDRIRQSNENKFPNPPPRSFVYHILGKCDIFPEFAIWEEDYVEYLCALIKQSSDEGLEGLFQLLHARHLLLLGAPFRDWIVRFFIRVARGTRLTAPRAPDPNVGEYLADETNNVGEPTVFFFNHLANATRVIQEDPRTFVTELFQRWQKSRDVSGSTRDFLDRLASEMPRDAIFISYSRDDGDSATRLAMRLAAANIPVWLDKERLHVGVNYERDLEYAVRDSCSFFISLISANTEADATRYVHKEREWAARRFQDGFIFYLPVVIDDTRDVDVKLEPACFRKIHRDRFAGGEPTDEFIRRLRVYMESFRTSGRPRD